MELEAEEAGRAAITESGTGSMTLRAHRDPVTRGRGITCRVGSRGVKILGLDPDPESDFQPFGDSGFRFGSSKKWNCNTSSWQCKSSYSSQFKSIPDSNEI